MTSTWVSKTNGFVDDLVGVVEHTAATIAIPVADGVVAWLAAENMIQVLGFSRPVSVLTGLALEGCGIVASRAALAVRRYNQTRANDQPPALGWLAWSLLGAQFLIGAVLVTVNTVRVDAMTGGLLTIAALSSIGTLSHMLENDVKAREENAKPAQPVAQTAQAPAQPAERDLVDVAQELAQPIIIEQPGTTRERVLRYYDAHPRTTQQECADALGISRQLVSNYRRNGHVEVLASEEGR
jgi:hypothetical protein